MITAQAPRLAGLTARLTARAESLAKAHSARTDLARRSDPARWRRAALLWPLFTKGG